MTQPKRKPGRPKAGAFGQAAANQVAHMLTPTNRKSVAMFLNVTDRSIWAALRVRAERDKRIAEGWACEHCGRRITSGRADKVFCSDSCRGHFHRDAKRLDARIVRMFGHLVSLDI